MKYKTKRRIVGSGLAPISRKIKLLGRNSKAAKKEEQKKKDKEERKKMKEEAKKNPAKKEEQLFYLYLSYHNTRVVLNDPEVDETNFIDIQRKDPERIVTIKRFFLPYKVPIKKIHIRSITSEYDNSNRDYVVEKEADE